MTADADADAGSDPTAVKELVRRADDLARAAFDAGSDVREALRAVGDDFDADVVDFEMNQLVKDMQNLRAGTWARVGGPWGLSVNVMINRGWENELDPRCLPFTDAVADASMYVLHTLEPLPWDWSQGLPPGWVEGFADRAPWPQPWNPPIPQRPGTDPTAATVGQPLWDRARRALAYRLGRR